MSLRLLKARAWSWVCRWGHRPRGWRSVAGRGDARVLERVVMRVATARRGLLNFILRWEAG